MSTAGISSTLETYDEDFALGVSKEAQESLKQYQKIYWHYHYPVSRPEDYVIEFYSLVSTWHKDTQTASSALEMSTHPGYQRIIGMGEKIVPLLLRELEERPDHWFWALGAITGENPILPEQRGKVGEMAKAWLDWGKDAGYEW